MSAARKIYTFRDTEIVLTSEADDDMPTVMLHINRKGPLDSTDLHHLKQDLLGLMIAAYNSFEFPMRAQQINTPQYTGYQLSYIGKAENKPTPVDFFNAAKEWLDTLQDKVQSLGSFDAGLAATKKDIGLNTPQPDPDDPDNRQATWSIPSTLNKNEYVIGDVHFEIEATHTDGKYRLNFQEDMKDFLQITEITEALRKLLVTNFALKDIKISITDDTESGAFNFIIKTDQSLSPDDFMRHCDRLVNDVRVNASKHKDVLKGIEVSIEKLEKTYRNNQRYSIEKALGDAFSKLPSLPKAAEQQKAAIAKELTDAVLQPYASIESAIDNIRERKGLSDDAQIRSRLRDALSNHIPITDKNDAQIKYYVGELTDALYVTIPRREPVQGRGG